MKILFVGPPRDVTHALRHGRLGEARRLASAGAGAAEKAEGFDNIFVTRPVKLMPDTLGVGRRANERLYRRHVHRAARELGLYDAGRRPVLWINPHWAGHLVGHLGEAAAVYDITDDWTTLTQSPRRTARIARQDADLLAKADATIVCSERLRQMKAGRTGGSLHLIANGVDAAHYARVLDGDGSPHPLVADLPRPVFGYVGTVHPDRVDVGVVAALAADFPGGSVVLAGPEFLPAEARSRLLRMGNVLLTGPVPYASVPDVMRGFDVCITPHRVTPFTESLNPIKLWEYLAAGKPIVSTDVAGFRDYPELVDLAGDAEQFVAAARRALAEQAERPPTSAARRREAREHSWERRADEVEGVFASVAAAPADDVRLPFALARP